MQWQQLYQIYNGFNNDTTLQEESAERRNCFSNGATGFTGRMTIQVIYHYGAKKILPQGEKNCHYLH